MNVLVLVVALAISASTQLNSPAINNKLRDALKVATSSTNGTINFVAEATKTSSTKNHIHMLIKHWRESLGTYSTMLSKLIDSNELDLSGGQLIVNILLSSSIYMFNEILVQITDRSVGEQFINENVKNYWKICGILHPLLDQSNNPDLVNSWRAINHIQITVIDALEFVNAQEGSGECWRLFSDANYKVRQANINLFAHIFADLFDNTLTPQNKKKYAEEYKKLNAEVVKVFREAFSTAEKAEEAAARQKPKDQQLRNPFEMTVNQVREIFERACENTLKNFIMFGYGK